MKFVAAVLVVSAMALTPAVSQADTIQLAAKTKSFDQCYKDCVARGSKPKNCTARCNEKS